MGAREILAKNRETFLGWPGVVRASVGSSMGSECIFIIVREITPELKVEIERMEGKLEGVPLLLDLAVRVGGINPFKESLDEYGSIDEARLDPEFLKKVTRRYGTTDLLKIMRMMEPSVAHEPPFNPMTGTMTELPPIEDLWGEYVSLGPVDLDDPKADDPVQGWLFDCGLISSLASLAWVSPPSISKAIIPGDRCHFTIRFYPENDDEPVSVNVNDKILCKVGSGDNRATPVFAHSFTEKDVWPGLFEKAYVTFRSGDPTGMPKGETYGVIARLDDVNTYLLELTGWAEMRLPDSNVLDFLKENCQSDQDLGFKAGENVIRKTKEILITSTRNDNKVSPLDFKERGLEPDHAFSVLGFTDGGMIFLRDPYGIREVESFASSQPDQTFSWYDDGGLIRGAISPRKLDGFFLVSADDFRKYFTTICGVKKRAPRIAAPTMLC